MKRLAFFLSGAIAASLLVPILAAPAPQGESEMKAAMEKMKRWTAPGENHKQLERFLGKWNIETRFYMGAEPTRGEKGTAEFRWKMDGRWLESDWTGSMMGMPVKGYMLLGYDNFKMSYVMTTVSTMETAMRHSEGDMTQHADALIMYGTLDEYMTGEHDKMCKYVWRFESKDKIVFEIHDLPIGETNTKVVEVTYTRAN